MATYRYNVVIEMGIDTDGLSKGKSAVERELRQWEKSAIDSQRRMDTEIEKSASARHSRMAKAHSDTIGGIVRQEEAATKSIIDNYIQRGNEINRQLDRELKAEVAANKTRINESLNAAKAREKHRADELKSFERFNRQIQALDPFQSLGARQQSLRGVGAQIRSEELAGFDRSRERLNSQIQALDPFQNLGNRQRTLQQAAQDIKAFDAEVGKSQKGLGMWGTAFKGAFIGAVAGITFSTIISGIFGITRALADGAVESVKYAANLEQTTNALAVFTGGTRSARQELKEIDQTARDTTGLRMIPAEEGFQRLRALGFQAQLSRSFIKELGEEKILSGASDESLSKIIFNFAQIASGGQKVSQELREIVTQMPTLKRAFEDAFGTTDPKRIQQIFDKDTEKAFQMLVDAMAKGKQATGGLNDAVGKLLDEFIVAGREFGEPFLDPLTRDVKDLTGYLRENSSMWRQLGTDVSDFYRGVSMLVRSSDPVEGGVTDILKRVGIGFATAGGSEAVRGFTTAGAIERRLIDPKAFDMSELFEMMETQTKEAEAKREREVEKSRQRAVAAMKNTLEDERAVRENFFKVEEARQRVHLNNTVEQELATEKRLSALRRAGTESQIDAVQRHYADLVKFGNLSDEELLEATRKRNEEIGKLSTELLVNQYESQRRQAELLKRQRDEERQAQQEFYTLQITATRQAFDKRIFDTERFIQKTNDVTGEGFSELIRLTNDSYLEIYASTRQNYELRLQDESLNNQQRINLTKEMNLTLQNLEEDNRQKILQIQERQYQMSLERIDRYADEFSKRVGSMTSQISGVSGSLRIGSIDQRFVKNLSETFFGGIDVDAVIADSQQKIKSLQSILSGVEVQEVTGEYFEQQKKLKGELEQHEAVVKRLTDSYPGWQKEIYKVVKAYQEGTASIEALQDAQLTLFDRETIARTIDFTNRIEALDAKIQEATGKGNIGDANKFKLEKETLITDKALFQFDAANKRAEMFDATIKGLTATIEKYRNADPATIRQLNDIFRGEKLEEQKATYQEIYRLKYDIANSPYIDSLEIEKAYLEDIVELRGRETEAVIRSNRAKLEIADKFVYSKTRADASVEEFLAQQKGITDILSEARINVITQAFNGLDAVAMSLSKNFGFAKDAVQQLISSLLRLVAIPLIQRALGIGGAGGIGGGSIPGLNIPGVGGIGVGGTAPFNPAGGNLIGGALQQFIGGGISPVNAGGANPAIGTYLGNGRYQGVGLGQTLSGGQGGFLASLFSGQGIGAALATGGISIGIAALAASLQTHSPLKGALLGGAVGFIAGILNRNRRRRREEKLRDTAIRDAFSQIDKLIEQVKMDKIDGDSAISQAEQIRQQYVESMGQLKDPKTREHALADVSRIDAKISELKSAVANQISRRERLELLVPTFGEGGSLSSFSRRNYRENPLGYRNESESIGYFRYNEKGSEYILDHETTSNVGAYHLDNMRATKGESFKSLLRNAESNMPSRAFGGFASPTTTATPTPTSASSNGASIVDVQVQLNGILLTEDLANALVLVLKKSDGTTELKNLSAAMRTDGQEFVTTLLDLLRQKGVKIS